MQKEFRRDGRGSELLSVEEMYRADQGAVADGVASATLMENAGRAIAHCIRQRWAPRPTAILCGPGNNGGDGFVVARLLAEEGWPITLALLGNREGLSGDAALNAGRWTGEVMTLDPSVLDGAELVVDALFGAGLARALDGPARQVVEAIDDRALPCIAVDMPSGVHGDSGAVLGAAPRCRMTVTFCRRKPGHLLLPGREFCGETVIADIGIPDSAVEGIAPSAWANGPALWGGRFPWPTALDHKYARGHALIAGGAVMTGAARLAARAAARSGAGMVSIAAPEDAVPVYAGDVPSLLVAPITDVDDFAALLDDRRKNAVLVGPGCGVSLDTREMTLQALREGKATVLDADALTVFRDTRDRLFEAIAGNSVVLTPHEGEFVRLFDEEGDKVARCRAAAEKSGAVILLKGADTVVAAPDGRVVVNDNAPPQLATAGAGDVLAGITLGLLAQGADSFDAACAAVWLHGEAAQTFGLGLIAGDLPEMLPNVLKKLKNSTAAKGRP